jgi:GNAT superfamily N-acetyltransferase
MARVTVAALPRRTWSVAPTLVGSADAADLLRDYYIDVSDRYFQHHFDRPSTDTEIEQGLADFPNDDLAPPTGVFLLARYGDDPAGCAGLRVLGSRTVELTRMFVRPAFRGTGGG